MVYKKRPERIFDMDSSGELFNTLRKNYGLKADCYLAEWLGVSKGFISKIRHGTKEVNAEIIILVHEKTGMPIKKIKELIATGGLREAA